MSNHFSPLFYLVVMGLVGGLTGYLTNVIAVKMLFKPEKPFCLLKGRFCIQGLVPARKEEIASRLAEIASEYALSGEIRERYITHLSFQVKETIRDTVFKNMLKLPPKVLIPSGIAYTIADAISEALTPRLLKLFDEASSKIDVTSIVKEEFRMLPTSEIERVFKQLAGRELKFIELAGLLLGSIIGIIEGILVLVLLPT